MSSDALRNTLIPAKQIQKHLTASLPRFLTGFFEHLPKQLYTAHRWTARLSRSFL
jgi:hypothetical protein